MARNRHFIHVLVRYCTSSVSLLILLLWRGSSWVNLFISCDGEGELSIASPVRVYIIKMVRVRVMVRVMVRVTHCFVVCLAIPSIVVTRSSHSFHSRRWNVDCLEKKNCQNQSHRKGVARLDSHSVERSTARARALRSCAAAYLTMADGNAGRNSPHVPPPTHNRRSSPPSSASSRVPLTVQSKVRGRTPSWEGCSAGYAWGAGRVVSCALHYHQPLLGRQQHSSVEPGHAL